MPSEPPLCHHRALAMYQVAEDRRWLTSIKKSPSSPGYWAATLQCMCSMGHWHGTKRPPRFVVLPGIHPHNSSPDLLICILLVLFLSTSGEWVKPFCQKSVYIFSSPTTQDGWLVLPQKDLLLQLSITPSRPWGSSSFPFSVNILCWHIWESGQISFLFSQLVKGNCLPHNEALSIGWGKGG